MTRARLLLALSIPIFLGAAGQAAPGRSFDLPEGRLGDLAVALGRQARISIGIRDPALARARVKRV
ncbi:MAG TPA: hypothetical protein VF652_08175, partial [Allosphingosinicella sp.]